ncbi:MAG: hypothetical protein P4L90_22675 [Rhodopila sp.]|nr:hypothetical protein [Rhodopila sp.]
MATFIKRIPTPQVVSGIMVAICLAAAPDGAFAQSASKSAAAGQQLAQQFCAQCHVIAPSSARGWTDAPAFDAIANRPATTAATLTAFIQKPHMHMLNTGRPPGEANEIATYIMSLRKS